MTPGFEELPLSVTDFNGDIQFASGTKTQVDLSYLSRSRAIASVRGAVDHIEVDGTLMPMPPAVDGTMSLMLPAGQHAVTLCAAPSPQR